MSYGWPGAHKGRPYECISQAIIRISGQAGAHKGYTYNWNNFAHVVRRCNQCFQFIGKNRIGMSFGFAYDRP